MNSKTYTRISIHALHEESDVELQLMNDAKNISIHALHEESDFTIWPLELMLDVFQSTLSMRRATISIKQIPPHTGIFQSTLSMRRATRSDIIDFCAWVHDFNPRSP